MSTIVLVHAGWILLFLICFYVVRHIRAILVRTLLTFIPCILLSNTAISNLPSHHIFSVFGIAIYWMISIRLIHLTVLSPDEYLTLSSFVLKCLWIIFPVVSFQSTEKQRSIPFYLANGILKVVLNCWLHRWLLVCKPNDSYQRVFVYFLGILTFSYIIDIQIVVIRLLTRDAYTFQPLNNFPFLSQSLREFWGRRYNRIIGTILNESIFQPLSSYISSRSFVALLTFTVSGLFHVHIAITVFDDISSIIPTFACFFINGIACCIEKSLTIKLPPLCGWIITHGVLIVTAPMCLGTFTRDNSVFFGIDAFSAYVDPLILNLPLPNSCPK